MSNSRLKGYCGLALGFVVATTSACSFITDAGGYKLPPPDLSLDPAALREPQLLYLCGYWVGGAAPAEQNILIDVSFSRPGPQFPEDRPTSAHIATIEKNGGQVLYQFHFPAVRVWIPTRNVPKLALSVLGVFKVADPRRYDWRAAAGFRLPYTYKEGEVRYGQLGGRVDYRFDAINSISGLIPDRSAATLRRDANVTYVESMVPYPFCY